MSVSAPSRFIETGEVPVRILTLPDVTKSRHADLTKVGPAEKSFNSFEPRNLHGEWESSGEELLHGWIDTSRLGPDGIGMTDDQATSKAELLSVDVALGSGPLSESIKSGISSWSLGDTDKNTADPLGLARFKLVVNFAQLASKDLYRGVSDETLVAQLKDAKPGDVIRTDRAMSWSASESIAREFNSGAMLYVESHHSDYPPSGARAVSISRYADPEFKSQDEWVAPPSSYEVISNEPDLVPGDPVTGGSNRFLKVREVQLPPNSTIFG